MGSLTAQWACPERTGSVKWEVPCDGADIQEPTYQGSPMITLQRRQLVGHDILLARHGNHISAMRVDRSAGRVVAFLDDGSTDSAPNLIAPGLRMPDTLRSVLREDWKFLTGISACSVGLAGLMFAASAALAGMSGDPALVQMLTAYSGN